MIQKIIFLFLLLSFTITYWSTWVTNSWKISTWVTNSWELQLDQIIKSVDITWTWVIKTDTLLNSLKKKQDWLKNLLSDSKISQKLKDAKTTKSEISFKNKFLKDILDSINSQVLDIKWKISKKEELKTKLLIQVKKSDKSKKEIYQLSQSLEDLKKTLKEKEYQLSTIIPKQLKELNSLKNQNDILISELFTLKSQIDIRTTKDLNTKIYISFFIFWLFLLSRIMLFLLKKYYFRYYQENKQRIQIFSIFSLIFLSLFSLIMIFVFNKDLLISLLFFWSAFVIVLKDFILSFFLSSSVVRTFKIWEYLTLDSLRGKVISSWINSLTVKVIDEETWEETWETLKIPNKFLNDKIIKYSREFYPKREIILKDLTVYEGWYEKILEEVKNIFSKYQVDFILSENYIDEKRSLKIKWKTNKSKILLEKELSEKLDKLKIEEKDEQKKK